MTDLILHHYDFSNYSEKVRVVLGLKGLAWHSVETPATLPKPDYLPLTAGYRRAPALQVGADVYCDTVRIIEELERRFPEPSLYPGAAPEAQRAFIAGLERWADVILTRHSINYAACTYVDAPRFTTQFLDDRAELLGKPEPGRERRRAAAPKNLEQLRPMLAWIEDIFRDGRRYACGDAMSLADCVLYHPLWIMDQLAGERVPVLSERLRDWMDHIAERGHGSPEPMKAPEALAVAVAAEPLPALPSEVLENDPALGEMVSITPNDYGRLNPAVGTLLSIDAHRLAIQHRNDRVGLVTTHFPRVGYRVRRGSV